MRARNIKPGFFKNEELSECSFPARLLFPGLWMLADREGRLEYRPKRIKAEVFPFDEVDIAALVSELQAHGLVKVYSVDGASYLWIIKFTEHQRPHQNETASIIPSYSGTDEGLATKVQSTCDQGANRFALNPSSLSPSLLNNESINTPLTPRRGECAYSASFEEFWSTYPLRKGKAAAYRAWKSVEKKHPGVKPPQIITAVKAQVEADTFRSPHDGQLYIPHPATWLNAGRWDDDVKSPGGGPDDPLAGLTLEQKFARARTPQ